MKSENILVKKKTSNFILETSTYILLQHSNYTMTLSDRSIQTSWVVLCGWPLDQQKGSKIVDLPPPILTTPVTMLLVNDTQPLFFTKIKAVSNKL